MIVENRAKNVALGGALMQTVFTGVLVFLWLWTGSQSAMAACWLVAGGIALWLMVALLCYCLQLARQEEIELEEIAARGDAGGTIFQEDASQLRPAATRVRFMYRWGVGGFTLAFAAFQAALGVLVLRRMLATLPATMTHTAQGSLFAILVAFPAFLFSRYATGMGRHPQWRALRATGSYQLAGALAMGAVFVSLLAAWLSYPNVDRVVAFILPAIQIVLAVELALNFILDLYRPHLADQEQRLSFDSRLLALAAEPGRVGHSIAETVNYQFGFEVSRTWFYQLVSRSLVPLILFAALVLEGMSAIVLVPSGSRAIVLHWGKADPNRATLGAGLHLKWPWPIDSVQEFDTREVQQVLLGTGPERTRSQRQSNVVNGHTLELWTQAHGKYKELNFLLAIPPERREGLPVTGETPPPPVSIIKLVASVQYVIRKDGVYDYGYRFINPQELLQCVASREMVRYCASATLNTPVGNGSSKRPEAIMTYGRQRAAQQLEKNIQAAADKLNLGVQITFVGFTAVHPPVQAAGAFEKVLEAERGEDEARNKAEGQSDEILAKVAGRPGEALKLALAIRTEEELELLRDNRSSPGDFARILHDDLHEATQAIKWVGVEIQRETLKGQGTGQNRAVTERLQGLYEQHLKLLQQVQAAGARFDYPSHIGAAGERATVLFQRATGTPAAEVAQAYSYRWKKEMDERARYESFQRELQAYRACPSVYRMDRWLDVFDKTLPNLTKYVLAVPRDKVQLWMNWEHKNDVMSGVTFNQSDARAGKGSSSNNQ